MLQPFQLLKSIPVKDADKQQTPLVFPVSFMTQFPGPRSATFQELSSTSLLVRVIGPHAAASNKTYKVVTHAGSSWTSVPRPWLRNLGAREGDLLDLYATVEPDALIVLFRRALR